MNLPKRSGDKPQTHWGLPHHQQTQIPASDLYDAMKREFLSISPTTTGQSLISVPGAQALFVPECEACNEAGLMIGREFAHIHPPHDGSFHMVLSPGDAEHVLEQGWGELHPYSASGKIEQRVVMVYAPRDTDEIEVIMQIAHASHAHATASD